MVEELTLVAHRAEESGEMSLLRAASDRLVVIQEILGDQASAKEAHRRSALARQAIERNLPKDLRAGFREHPRNRRG